MKLAAERELHEELNLKLPLKELFTLKISTPEENNFVTVFETKMNDGKIVEQEEEVSKTEFYSIEKNQGIIENKP